MHHVVWIIRLGLQSSWIFMCFLWNVFVYTLDNTLANGNLKHPQFFYGGGLFLNPTPIFQVTWALTFSGGLSLSRPPCLFFQTRTVRRRSSWPPSRASPRPHAPRWPSLPWPSAVSHPLCPFSVFLVDPLGGDPRRASIQLLFGLRWSRQWVRDGSPPSNGGWLFEEAAGRAVGCLRGVGWVIGLLFWVVRAWFWLLAVVVILAWLGLLAWSGLFRESLPSIGVVN